jgi:hypothetical protein
MAVPLKISGIYNKTPGRSSVLLYKAKETNRFAPAMYADDVG